MKQTTFYTYLGTNGTVTTHIELENVPHVKTYELIADKNKVLTKDNGITYTTYVYGISNSELQDWEEIDIPVPGQN